MGFCVFLSFDIINLYTIFANGSVKPGKARIYRAVGE
jgi:hypothetical protein